MTNSSSVLAQAEKTYRLSEYTAESAPKQVSRQEIFDGETIASQGASRRHNLIVTNITIAIGSRLRRHNHELYANNMNVKLSEKDFCYPDITIVKDDPKFFGKEADILTNPTVIIEVMPERIALRDQSRRLEKYLSLESIREYLLVREGEMRVEHYAKQNPKQWVYKIYDASDDLIAMESINCKVSLGEFYAQIKY